VESGVHVPAILPKSLWKLLLAVGAVVWIIASVITGVTQDTILVPSVVLLGSFLVPTTMVAFALSRPRRNHLALETVLLGFLGGGTLGVCFAALTEVYLLPTAYGTFFGVGVIEETAKAIVLVAVARSVPVHDPREGMILGATVGAGFAAFETSGYALKAFLENADDHGVLNIVGTEAVRAVSAPFGHIMWTSILGGALFAAWSGGRPHLTRRVGLTFLGVVVLHAMWDASNGWAITLTQGILGDGWTLDWPKTKDWVGFPTGQELEVYNAISFALLVIIASVGTLWLVRRWRAYAAAAQPSS
jgi:RsiW-degrading membrane proteinase PrsW (M82 family)